MKKMWALLLSVMLLMVGTTAVAKASTYNQKTPGLTVNKKQKFKLINNHNYFMPKNDGYSYADSFAATDTFQNAPDVYKTVRGNTPAVLKTSYYLPMSYRTDSLPYSIQNVTVTADGGTAYVVYLVNDSASQGWIVKYDLAKLRSVYGAESSNMDVLRRASYAYAKGKATPEQLAVLKCLTVGPKFNAGHCQSLSLNPKNGQLWFTRSNGKAGATVAAVRVAKSTLKPYQTVNFRLKASDKSKMALPDNLTFDKRGYAYFSVYAGKTVKFYQGTISPQKVQFHLVMQGLKHQPGATHQGMAYNPRNDRLYMVTDDELLSVPTVQITHGKAKASQVKVSVFDTKREFEGLSFLKDGRGYLLLNRGPELLEAKGL